MTRLPWAILVTTGALYVTALAGGTAGGDDPASSEWTVVALLALLIAAFGGVGALVAARVPRNPVGWLLLATAVLTATASLATARSDTVLGAWVTSWLWTVASTLPATFALLLFPTGRLPSPGWRWAGRAAAAGLLLAVIGSALAPGPLDGGLENPIGLAGAGAVLGAARTAGAVLLAGAVLACIASLVARHRRAAATERRQLQWLVLGGLVVLAGLGGSAIAELAAGAPDDVVNATIVASLCALPLAMGAAIVRDRLWDIELVVNRALVYGGLTAALGATFAGLVLLAGLALGDSSLSVALATLAVAGLARPARARIQAGVDRRFHRRRYDARRELEAFGLRLRDQVDLEALGGELRGVVGETVQPAHVSLWLREPR